MVVPAAGCLKQLLTGCTRWIHPLSHMTFHVLINNPNIFCARYPPNVSSLGCPSATAQAREGSHRSLQITVLRHWALGGRAGRFRHSSFTHHRSTRGPGERATSRPRASPGKGPGPCQVWQLLQLQVRAAHGEGVTSSSQSVRVPLARITGLTSFPSSRLPRRALPGRFARLWLLSGRYLVSSGQSHR